MSCAAGAESESELQGADPLRGRSKGPALGADRGDQTAGSGWVLSQREISLKPLRAVLMGHPIPAPLRQPGRENQSQRTLSPVLWLLQLASTALSRHMERGLPTTPCSPTSPAANNSCLTTNPSGIPAMCPKHMSLPTLSMFMIWGTPPTRTSELSGAAAAVHAYAVPGC
eukprot:365160-Chlamydomonas_euryale.AAC.3